MKAAEVKLFEVYYTRVQDSTEAKAGRRTPVVPFEVLADGRYLVRRRATGKALPKPRHARALHLVDR